MKRLYNITQEYDWDCGVAAVQTMFFNLCDGREISHRKVVKALESSQYIGTGFYNMQKGILKLDKTLQVETHIGATLKKLREWNDAGAYLIVDWWDQTDGHYSHVADITLEYITLSDPQYHNPRTIDNRTFYTNWFDWSGEFEDKLWIDRGVIKIVKT